MAALLMRVARMTPEVVVDTVLGVLLLLWKPEVAVVLPFYGQSTDSMR
jgi:hypothetical protein